MFEGQPPKDLVDAIGVIAEPGTDIDELQDRTGLDIPVHVDGASALMGELREVRIEGSPTVEEFMERRLAPAMHTCDAVSARQDALGRRIADSNDLAVTVVRGRTVAVRVPMASWAIGAQLNTPALGELTISKPFDLLGGGPR